MVDHTPSNLSSHCVGCGRESAIVINGYGLCEDHIAQRNEDEFHFRRKLYTYLKGTGMERNEISAILMKV